MRGNNDRHADHFDLLPFIAILMCTLGCLLLVTLSMAAISVGPSKTEGWIPIYDKTAKHPKKPILVEWDGSQLVVHTIDDRIITGPFDASATSDSGGTPSFSPELQSFMDWIVANKDHYYVLLAVRPSGFGHIHTVHDAFTNRGLDIGMEPVDQARPIKLLAGETQ